MAKFKVGDRVRVTDEEDPEYGKIGTVTEVSENPWIVFDEPTKYGGDANDSRAGWVAGHMDCFREHYLELVGALTVDTCIALYRGACEQFEAAELALEKAKAAVQDARLNLRDALDGET